MACQKQPSYPPAEYVRVRLYLDTNVVIRGAGDSEHRQLKRLALDSVVMLYWSPTVQHEQGARSRKEALNPLPEKPAAVRSSVARREALDQAERAEVEWWRPARLHYPKCTFEGLITMAPVFGGWDPTGEARLLTDLLDNHGVKQTDAIHLMIAHSAKMDAFLTWDDQLIKKATRILWLRPCVETPRSFLTRAVESVR